MVTVRKARPEDLEAITDIYNDAIAKTTATFDTEPKTLTERSAWLGSHDGRHPVLVAEHDGLVVGWASLSRWSDRRAYDGTAEVSFYVAEPFRGRGIGKRLLGAVVEAGQKVGLHTLLARVAEGNDASLHLCRSLGFRDVGTMEEVGRKFGKWLNVHLLQRMCEAPADPAT